MLNKLIFIIIACFALFTSTAQININEVYALLDTLDGDTTFAGQKFFYRPCTITLDEHHHCEREKKFQFIYGKNDIVYDHIIKKKPKHFIVKLDDKKLKIKNAQIDSFKARDFMFRQEECLYSKDKVAFRQNVIHGDKVKMDVILHTKRIWVWVFGIPYGLLVYPVTVATKRFEVTIDRKTISYEGIAFKKLLKDFNLQHKEEEFEVRWLRYDSVTKLIGMLNFM